MGTTGVAPVPFMLLGESRRREIARRLSAAATAWYRRWSNSADEVRVEVGAPEHAVKFRGSGLHVRCTTPHAQELMSLQTPSDLAMALLGGATGASAATGGASGAAGVLAQITRSLAEALLQEAGIRDAQIDEVALGVAHLPLRRISAVVRLGTRAEIPLCLQPQMIERLLPRVVPFKGESLQRRQECIGHASMRVEALLGEAEVTLADLARLAADDVIVLDRQLTEYGHLLDEQGRSIARVTFGRTGSMFACSATVAQDSEHR